MPDNIQTKSQLHTKTYYFRNSEATAFALVKTSYSDWYEQTVKLNNEGWTQITRRTFKRLWYGRRSK